METLNLKSIRETLQEIVEDDATGRGSASRLGLILTTLTLCLGLLAAIAATIYAIHDSSSIINALIMALTAGGAGPYTAKRVVEVFKGGAPAPQQPPE